MEIGKANVLNVFLKNIDIFLTNHLFEINIDDSLPI